jgi:uncharacterized protein (UPF0305 family)
MGNIPIHNITTMKHELAHEYRNTIRTETLQGKGKNIFFGHLSKLSDTYLTYVSYKCRTPMHVGYRDTPGHKRVRNS